MVKAMTRIGKPSTPIASYQVVCDALYRIVNHICMEVAVAVLGDPTNHWLSKYALSLVGIESIAIYFVVLGNA